MNILVTGGAGYIGSVLVERLLRDQHHVIVLDNFMYGQTSLVPLCVSNLLTVVRGDALDQGLVARLLQTVDAVIPLAAIVGAPACKANEVAAWATNKLTIEHLVSQMSKDQRLIVPITNSGYGIGAEMECDETSPLNPISIYGSTKVEAEQITMQHPGATSLRLATVFGVSPRMRLDLMVNDFVYRAVHDRSLVLFEGHFRRNFVHVRDVVNVFMMALYRDDMRGQIYNVGDTDANMTKRDLCRRIADHVPGFWFGEALVGQDPDKRDYVVSNAKIEALGWRPKYSLDDGIQELIKAYQIIKRTEHANA